HSLPFHLSPSPPYFHSFPTRRSSDLIQNVGYPRVIAVLVVGAIRDCGIDAVVVAVMEPCPGKGVVRDELQPLGEPLVHFDLQRIDRKSTRLNSSHVAISYAVFCLKKK